MVFCAKDVLDLAVGFGVIRPVLHGVYIGGAHGKGRQNLIVFRACDKNFRLIRHTSYHRRGAGRDINAFRLAIPDIHPAGADIGEMLACHIHINRARCRHDAGFIAQHG